MGKWSFLRNSNYGRTVKSILLIKMFWGLVEMTFGLARMASLKIPFFAPWLQRPPKNKRICMKNVSCHPATLEWFSIQLLVNSEIFKLSLNLSLTHLRAQIACYELKGDLSPAMLKGIFHDSMKIPKFKRICMENHSSVTRGQKKMFFSYKSF